MQLTPAQKQTLKAHFAANTTQLPFGGGTATIASVFGAASLGSGDALLIAGHYSGLASPDFWAWRTLVEESEIYEQASVDATFWSWTIYIARSQAERESWRQMVTMRGGLKPALANVRTGVGDIFSGAGGANQRTHLLTVSRRKVTVAEKVFATGTGSTAVPGDLAIGLNGAYAEGTLSGDEVSDIHGIP